MRDPARKMFMGVRLRRLRAERNLTQGALARALEISPSYLNQIENNQRPLTIAVLLKLNAAFGIDVQLFSDDEAAGLIAQLRDALASAPGGEAVTQVEIRELTLNMPAAARAIAALDQRHREALEQLASLSMRLGGDRSAITTAPPMAYDEVRNFFHARRNHIAELESAAEAVVEEEGLRSGVWAEGLAARLRRRHGVTVAVDEDSDHVLRAFDPERGVLHLSARLRPGQQAFQLATQLAFLELKDLLGVLIEGTPFSDGARGLARIGLANYFAGAVILPYAPFLVAAESLAYDIERLCNHFGVGFETACHRLSTLQRPGASGVPFIFIRVDRAGNISKRQSATDFHFARMGGTCPLWNVYEAFAHPGEVFVQAAEMPDGRRYLWIARVVRRSAGYSALAKTFAIGLGCDLRHADRLVYSRGLDLTDPAAFTPIGIGCRMCERPSCSQRAFPPASGAAPLSENQSRFTPYSAV